MAGKIRVIMLGCGGSQGVPTATGDWGACDPANPKNRRSRPSVVIQAPDAAGTVKTLLVDTGPDLREQMLRNDVTRLDGVLFTHSHADHTHGIDELRSFNRTQRMRLPIWASAEAMGDLRQRFGYVLEQNDPAIAAFYKPTIDAHVIDGPFEAAGIEIVPFVQDHGFTNSLGFRIGDFAYSTDFVRLDDVALAALQGVRTWIVDCVRIQPAHPTHCHLEASLHWIGLIKPERAVLTHLDPSADYAAITRLLPPGVEAGWDGLVLEA
ncbi:MAG TPA: MBL fold metallo-hydrolase [Stellaceae bacterium]|nr:MBL fold metallo-hydrolase [Stellaceae bacterium]